jgi:hypothetical protein
MSAKIKSSSSYICVYFFLDNSNQLAGLQIN